MAVTWAYTFDTLIDPYTSMGILLYVNYVSKQLLKKKDMITLCHYVTTLRSDRPDFLNYRLIPAIIPVFRDLRNCGNKANKMLDTKLVLLR